MKLQSVACKAQTLKQGNIKVTESIGYHLHSPSVVFLFFLLQLLYLLLVRLLETPNPLGHISRNAQILLR